MFLYLTKSGLQINKEGWTIVITDNDTKITRKIPFNNIEWVVIFWRIQLTTDVITSFLKAKTPVFFLSKYWNYFWKLDSIEIKNVELLYKHIEASTDNEISLLYAKKIIISKIWNSIIMLKRWARFDFFQQKQLIRFWEIIEWLKEYKIKVGNSNKKSELRWYEWNASKIYYEAFWMFLPSWFEFIKRTRRPPLDEINAMLSLWYTLLAQTIQMILNIQGIEAQLWFFHKPKDLRTLLVLDVMEMYRSWIIDDMIIRVLSKDAIKKEHFFINTTNSSRPVLFSQEWLHIFLSEYYKTVFSKSQEEKFWNYKKLSLIEKDLEVFKQSLVKSNPDFYEGFKIK
jgi:CRISP-associated protein Cas1